MEEGKQNKRCERCKRNDNLCGSKIEKKGEHLKDEKRHIMKAKTAHIIIIHLKQINTHAYLISVQSAILKWNFWKNFFRGYFSSTQSMRAHLQILHQLYKKPGGEHDCGFLPIRAVGFPVEVKAMVLNADF